MEHDDRWIGVVLDGRYQVQTLVSKGAMGAVYRALQLNLDRQVAIKVLENQRPEIRDVAWEERFRREAHSLAQLSHPNTVRIFDFGVHEPDGIPWLAMELVEGMTLNRMLRLRPPSFEVICSIGLQICGALAEAHTADIVHRDLKPGNVLIGKQPGTPQFVKLVDFGLVKHVGDDTLSELRPDGPTLGTPAYMAPEQIRGGKVDGRTDLYALGILLFRMAMGQTPFHGERGTAMLLAHIQRDPPSFDQLRPGHGFPPAFEWTVRTLLAKRPQDRFANAEETARALQACQLAGRHPDRPVEIRLVDGRAVLPPGFVEDDSGSTSLLQFDDELRPSLDRRLFSIVAAAFLGGAAAAALLSFVGWLLLS